MKTRISFDNYYGAKFARTKKAQPKNWVVIADGLGWYLLKQIGGFK